MVPIIKTFHFSSLTSCVGISVFANSFSKDKIMDFISDIDAVKRSLIESTELIKSFEDGKSTVFFV